jgi:hypothetical protein
VKQELKSFVSIHLHERKIHTGSISRNTFLSNFLLGEKYMQCMKLDLSYLQQRWICSPWKLYFSNCNIQFWLCNMLARCTKETGRTQNSNFTKKILTSRCYNGYVTYAYLVQLLSSIFKYLWLHLKDSPYPILLQIQTNNTWYLVSRVHHKQNHLPKALFFRNTILQV